VTLTVDDGRGSASSAATTITATDPAPPPTGLLVNGDFSRGLEGWALWRERGSLNPVVENGRLRLAATGHNGGVHQPFSTGGAGREISIDGFWATGPTAARAQWAEVIVINGARRPIDGQDVNTSQPDVVLVYKNDTWASPSGWSGTMRATSPVVLRGSFVAASDVATIVLKSGNLLGINSGTTYDDVVVTASSPSPNRPPTAKASAAPTSGAAPLAVTFDGRSSTDPDGDDLTYSWSFGDGATAASALSTHTYLATGSFNATLTVSDGRGGAHSATVAVSVVGPEWDPRLSTLGLEIVEASVPPGTWYWKLASARFESDGEILPPPGGGSESSGTHSIYVRALNPDGSPIENQAVLVSWPNGSPTSSVTIRTKSAVDGFWGDFPMAGGWCPYFLRDLEVPTARAWPIPRAMPCGAWACPATAT
jgi:PKD repeat protein